jgi:long-chain acyl-CoA synthetase
MDNHIIIQCPHCKEYIQVFKNEFNCKIFRHGVFKSNLKQIDPHLKKEDCDLLKEKDLKGSVIKKFLVLPKELDADDDELTRTRKVRRNFINEKYKILIDALYSNVDNCDFETKVTFEDGRTGSLKANVKILDC